MTYYPIWIAPGGQNPIRRGPDAETVRECLDILREKLAQGYASMGGVVRIAADGSRELMVGSIRPPSARKVIQHYEDMLERIDEDGD